MILSLLPDLSSRALVLKEMVLGIGSVTGLAPKISDIAGHTVISVLVEIGRCFCMLILRTLPCCHLTTFCEGYSSPFTFLLVNPLPDLLARFLCNLLVVGYQLFSSPTLITWVFEPDLGSLWCQSSLFSPARDAIQRDLDRLRGGPMQTSYSSARPSPRSCMWSWTISSTNAFWVEPGLF